MFRPGHERVILRNCGYTGNSRRLTRRTATVGRNRITSNIAAAIRITRQATGGRENNTMMLPRQNAAVSRHWAATTASTGTEFDARLLAGAYSDEADSSRGRAAPSPRTCGERVGVRGLSACPNPWKAPSSRPSPRKRGEGEASGCANLIEICFSPALVGGPGRTIAIEQNRYGKPSVGHQIFSRNHCACRRACPIVKRDTEIRRLNPR